MVASLLAEEVHGQGIERLEDHLEIGRELVKFIRCKREDQNVQFKNLCYSRH